LSDNNDSVSQKTGGSLIDHEVKSNKSEGGKKEKKKSQNEI